VCVQFCVNWFVKNLNAPAFGIIFLLTPDPQAYDTSFICDGEFSRNSDMLPNAKKSNARP
jgi:hypothetical protein